MQNTVIEINMSWHRIALVVLLSILGFVEGTDRKRGPFP